MKNYDFIILGAGASGLMLAYRMTQDSYFEDKSILIIDEQKAKGNDRTWCYWESGIGEWDSIVSKSWSKIYFGSKHFSKTITITPYKYKMIRSGLFYDTLWTNISSNSNVTFVNDKVIRFAELGDQVEVKTQEKNYRCTKLFNSIPNPEVYISQTKYPVLQQHFVGWVIQTKDLVFDDSVATFMDFDVEQKGNTRFMYVLPITKNTALFEYTLFSRNLLRKTSYEEAIVDYLKKKKIDGYTVIEKEAGSIPMTSYKFSELNSKHILNIGTAGGWTKASTGYTFKNATKKTKQLIIFIKTEKSLSYFQKQRKYWVYDLLFLDVLARHNEEGSSLFASMFRKAKTSTIFRFLDEESTLVEDLKVIKSIPPKRFIQALFKRLF